VPAGSVWKKAPTRERTRCIPCAKRFARAAVAPTHVEHVERRRSDAEVACVAFPVKGLNLFYFLGTIVSGLGTHNSNTSGRTNPTGRARYHISTARHARKSQHLKSKSKPQTAFGKESQKTKSSAIYCRHSDPKRTDMRNDAMCNVQQYKWTFETSSSTQHLSTWIRRVPTYVRGRGGGDLEYHSLAASCGACHSEGTMASLGPSSPASAVSYHL
jgi:hypothetical protein